MTKKEIMRRGFSVLDTYYSNLGEIDIILDEVEKNSQIITKDSILDVKDKTDVFFDEGEELVLKSDFLKQIEEKNTELEEFDVLFVLLSLEGTDGNHYQLISVDKYNNVYVNFQLLKKLNFNEYYYIHLANLKHEQFNLSNILNILFRGMLFYATDYFKQQYSPSFEQFPIFKRMEILKTLFDMVNSHAGTIEDRIYVYMLSKYRVFEKLKGDLKNLRKSILSRESGNFVLLREDFPLRNKNVFRFKTEIPSSPEEINEKTGLSYYQSIILNSLKYTNEYVLGLAGSGKTYMAATMAKIFLLFKAVWFANTRKGLPIQYISFSKESVQNSFLPKVGDLGIYFEKNSDLTIASFTNKLSEIENSYFSDEDYERLKKLDAIFRNKREILRIIETLYKREEEVENLYRELLTKKETSTLLRIIKTLEEKHETMGLALKIKMVLFRFLKKEGIGKAVGFSKEILKTLSRFKEIDKKELTFVDYMDLEKVLNKYKNLYLKKIKAHINNTSMLLKEDDAKILTEISVDELDYKNIFFYVRNMYRLLSDSEIEKIKISVQKLVYKNDEIITDQDYDNINKITGIIALPIDDIFNIPINTKAIVTLIDESILINQFLYYSIFSRTLIGYSFGDINQMNLNFLYNKSALFEKIKRFYMTKNKNITQDVVLRKNVFLNDKYNVASIWDAIFKMTDNVNLLIDNFRNIRYLVYTLIRTNPTYVSYIKKFISKNKNILDKKIVETMEKAETIDDMVKIVNIYNNEVIKFKDFLGNETDIPLILFDNTDCQNRIETFKKLFKFLNIQDFKIDNVLIVSVFKQNVEKMKNEIEIVREEAEDLKMNIDVLPADKIQALEYDIVVLFIEDSNSRNYIIENDKLLNVILSRAKKGFITVCKIESNCTNNIIADIFRENNFQVIKG